MSISEARLAFVRERMIAHEGRESQRSALELILLADDAYRATHPPAASGTDTEPELPSDVIYEPDDGETPARYFSKGAVRHSSIWRDDWSPEQLEAIAQHMRWRDRQRTREQEAAKVTPSGAAYNAVFERLRESDLPAITKVELAEAIEDAFAAFLEAQRREAGKGGDHA